MHHSTETQLARKAESDSWDFGSLNQVGSAHEHQNSTATTEKERSYLIGEKRAFGSFLGSDRDSDAKRQRIDTATSEEDAKPSLDTLDTGDAKPDISATPTPAGSRTTVRKGPFLIDDSSDDEDDAIPPTRQAGYGHYKAEAKSSPNQRNGSTAAVLAAQREASARMRTGALSKRSANSINQGSSGSGRPATGANPSATTANSRVDPSHHAQQKTSVRRGAVDENSRNEMSGPQAPPKSQPSASTSKTPHSCQKGTTIDLTGDDEDDAEGIEARPPQGSSLFNTAGPMLQSSKGGSSNGTIQSNPKSAAPSNLHDVFTFGSRPARREAVGGFKFQSEVSKGRPGTSRREQELRTLRTSPSPLPKRPSLSRSHQNLPQTPVQRAIDRTGRGTREETRSPTQPPGASRAGILEQMKQRRADAERQLRLEESREDERNRREVEDQKRRDEARRLAAEKQAQLIRRQQETQRQNHERQVREEEEQRRREQELEKQVKKHQEAERARKAEEAAERAAAKREEERQQMKMRAAAHEERIQKQKDRNARNADEDDDEIIIEDPGDPKALIRTGLRSIASQAFQIPVRPTARQNGHVQPGAATQTPPSGLATGAPRPLSSAQGALAVARSNQRSGPMQATGNPAREKEPEEPALEVGHPAGEILPADAKLLQWRKQGLNFPQIIPLYSKETGKTRMREWLRVRHHQVEHAIKGKAVSEGLLARVAEGEPEAIEQINKIVNGSYPVLSEQEIEKQKNQLLARRPGRPADNRVPLNPKVPKHQPAVGEVRQRDCKIVMWKDEGSTWPEVRTKYFDEYEDEWSDESFRKRYLVLEETFKSSKVDGVLVRRAANGDAAALKRINVLIHGEGFRGSDEDQGHKTPALALPKQTTTTPRQPQSQTRDETADESSETNEEPAEEPARTPADLHQVAAETAEDKLRPTTGGKMMNEAAFMYYLEIINSQHAEQEEAEETDEEEEPVQEDRHFYVYRIFRRDLDLRQLESYEDIDPNDHWYECEQEDYGDRNEANSKALEILWLNNWLVAANGEHHGGSQGLDEDLCLHSGLTMPGFGRVEVCVQQILKYGEPAQVTGAENTIPSTAYYVKQKTVNEDIDEVLDESHKISTVDLVENTCWTDLSLASKYAAQHFVKATFKSSSINLNQREAEQKAMLAGYYEIITAHPEEPFDKETEDKKLRVWVEKMKVEGPRNV